MTQDEAMQMAQHYWPSDRSMWSADGNLPKLVRFATEVETRLRDTTVAALRSENARLREEVMHLRIYAPGTHAAHQIRMAPVIDDPDLSFWGISE